MRLNHLSLHHFRNIERVDIALPERTVLFVGSNAQGKTSILEAIYYLATFSSFQTSADKQLIQFTELENSPAVARIVAEMEKKGKKIKMEVRVIQETNAAGIARTRKEILIDGVKKPPSAAIGTFISVLFIPQMFSIMELGPEVRRRYLNLTLAQVIPGYAKALSKYQQVLAQRNALLKELMERGGDSSQLAFWDQQLVEWGSQIVAARANALRSIDPIAQSVHSILSEHKEDLKLNYMARISHKTAGSHLPAAIQIADVKDVLDLALKASRLDELRRGITLVGPHRDDLRLLCSGIDLGDFGSRGQVKTALLSMKLAEYQWMKNVTSESPVILLDEVMSEIDSSRRAALLRQLGEYDQAILTTTDADAYTPDFISHSRVWRVQNGGLAKS